ncbi:AEC family transporter [Falsiroseomonas sp. E2-1-a20]|uniref:AEC family transporter n=1 Tax=Falsiroseomonas sp. E2-1-a20 TaxID=3239300 RepID=UPI003F2FA1F8
MTNLALLLLCFAIGIALRWSGRLPDNAPQALNGFVINVALPALILRQLHDVTFDWGLAWAALTPWILFAAGIVFFLAVSRLARWSRETTGGLMLAEGLANTSFIGLPMIETFYGPAFLSVGIIVDQLGTYLVLSTVGVVVAMVYSSKPEAVAALDIARRVLVFPPFQALVLALALAQVGLPEPALTVLERLGSTLVPLALVSVGFQLRLGDASGLRQELVAGLGFKLALGPAIVATVVIGAMGASGKVVEVSIFEAAMGPQIDGTIMAMQYGLNPRLMTLMVGLGIPLSLVTATAWWWILST